MEWLIVPIVWIACAWIASSLLEKRGQSGTLGCMLGWFLGPLGIIIALLVPFNTSTLEQRQIESGKLRPCPFCAEPIRTEANVCKHCGRDVPPATTRRPADDDTLRDVIVDTIVGWQENRERRKKARERRKKS